MKSVLKLLGGVLVLLGVWYVMMWFLQGSPNGHLDLAAMCERFTSRYNGSLNYQTLLERFNSMKNVVINIGKMNVGTQITNAILGNTDNFWSTTASVFGSVLSPTVTMVQSVVIIGYAVAMFFDILGILFFTIEPVFQFVFDPIFVVL